MVTCQTYARWGQRARLCLLKPSSGVSTSLRLWVHQNAATGRPEQVQPPRGAESHTKCANVGALPSGFAISLAVLILPVPSSAATASCRKHRARCNAACWAARWKAGTKPVSPSQAKSASWCAPNRYRQCRCTFGVTKATPGTCPVTLTCTPVSGGTATGSKSPNLAVASSTAAATRRLTATACAWAPASCTARLKRCPRCWTRWWLIWNIWAAKVTCRCSSY